MLHKTHYVACPAADQPRSGRFSADRRFCYISGHFVSHFPEPTVPRICPKPDHKQTPAMTMWRSWAEVLPRGVGSGVEKF